MKNLKPEQAKTELENNILFIDIREGWERDRGYIPGSVWLPLSELNERRDEIPEDDQAVIYCEHGERSVYVLSVFTQMGYDNLINLDGGFVAWKSAGLPDNKSGQTP